MRDRAVPVATTTLRAQQSALTPGRVRLGGARSGVAPARPVSSMAMRRLSSSLTRPSTSLPSTSVSPVPTLTSTVRATSSSKRASSSRSRSRLRRRGPRAGRPTPAGPRGRRSVCACAGVGPAGRPAAAARPARLAADAVSILPIAPTSSWPRRAIRHDSSMPSSRRPDSCCRRSRSGPAATDATTWSKRCLASSACTA